MKKHLTPKEISEEYGLTPRYWTRMACTGKIPGAWQPSGPGGAWLFEAEPFRRWRETTQRKAPEWQVKAYFRKPVRREKPDTGEGKGSLTKEEINEILKGIYGDTKPKRTKPRKGINTRLPHLRPVRPSDG